MKVLILGATGETGREAVAQALEAGHDVTVLVRDQSRFAAASDRVRVVVGDATKYESLLEAVRGQDAVVSALGVGQSLKSGGLITRAMGPIIQAMTEAKVRRLVFTSAYGVGDTWRDAPAVPRILMRTLLRDLYADKAAGEEILKKSALDWTLVYPVTLTNGPRTGKYTYGERLTLRGVPRISRADVAAFLLTQAASTQFVRKGVLVA